MKYEAIIRLAKYLKRKKIKYEFDQEQECAINILIETEDFPLSHRLIVFDGPASITLYSDLGFEFKEEKQMDILLAVAMANYSLDHGCFEVDMEESLLFYRIQTCLPENGKVEPKFFEYLLVNANHTIDYYNDLFFLVSENKITLDEFFQGTKNYDPVSF